MERTRTTLSHNEAYEFYKYVVEKPLASRNPVYYHPCCHTYTKRKREKNKCSHTISISFRTLFLKASTTEAMIQQVRNFYDRYCELYGYLPEKDLPHKKKPSDLSSEEEESAKGEPKSFKKSDVSTLGSRFDRDKQVASPMNSRLEGGLRERVANIENQICKIRPESNRAVFLSERLATENEVLTAENERLSDELSQVKKELAEQKKTLKAVNARLDAIEKKTKGGVLGKRYKKDSSSEKDKASSDKEEPKSESHSKPSLSSSEIREKDVEDKS
jgi:hypothetical protein